MAEQSINALKKTPLFSLYEEQGVKLTDFGGWALPIQFTGIMDEHHAVRNSAGLFDVSHMGEILVKGKNATEWLNQLVTNDVTKVTENQAQYTAVCNEKGGTLDDLILFKISGEAYLVTPNAANTEKIYSWMLEHQTGEVELENQSDEYGLIALQGPKSERILSKLTGENLAEMGSYQFIWNARIADVDNVLLSRTGYTGEDGFELYAKTGSIVPLWNKLLEAGEEFGIQPCGLGARDTLRLEAGMALYGQDLNEDITPLEGGIGFAVKTDKEVDFIGKEALKQQREEGLERVSRGFEVTGKGIARHGYPVLNENGEAIGEVTSGTKSPTLNKSIGIALVQKEFGKRDTPILIQVRNRQIEAKITKKPFYKKG